MPQIFQVLKCYKCLLFQVHQTKKSNKWICKVCCEKQSVKRHYGIGTAKDCRLHVQKLNNLRGDKEEANFKNTDSENSESENDEERIAKINTSGTPQVDDNKNNQLQSKWLDYVETEQVSEVNEPMYLDNKEVFLELPQKWKQKQTTHKQKIAKIARGDENNEILYNPSNLQHQCISETNIFNNDNRNNIVDTKTELSISQAKASVHNKNPEPLLSVIGKGSKWDHFIEADETIHDESDQKLYENFGKGDQFVQTTNENDDDVYNYKQRDQSYCHKAKSVTCIDSDKKIQSSINEPLFSLCDDSDLDEVLDF